MEILVCNDDGINSKGLLALAKALSFDHNVVVVAPSKNRSATSHAITVGKRLKFKKIKNYCKGIKAYSLSGMPADCVKFALTSLSEHKFDAVVSGINKGANLGTDILYSGTVSAALEAVFFNLPAIAVSLTSHTSQSFDYAANFLRENIQCLIDTCKGEFVWNVNVPSVDKHLIEGVKYTKMGYQVYSDNYKKNWFNNYSLFGDPIVHDKNDPDCDVEWNLKNYVTITPIRFNKTCFETLEQNATLCQK